MVKALWMFEEDLKIIFYMWLQNPNFLFLLLASCEEFFNEQTFPRHSPLPLTEILTTLKGSIFDNDVLFIASRVHKLWKQ